MSIVYLNNTFISLAEAKIPVLDRGFLFGDGIYEVIPVYNEKLFRVDEHLHRLEYSLNAIRIPNPYTTDQWKDLLTELVRRNASDDPKKSLYLQVTRGADHHRIHTFPKEITPTVFMKIKSVAPVNKKDLAKGRSAITLDDHRWLNCDIKSIALLANVLLHQKAVESGCEEAILIRDGKITEGASSNVFLVKDNTIITPPQSKLLLSGVTRELTIELAKENNLSIVEKDIVEPEFLAADEVWITSSNREIVPIVSVDGRQIAQGTAGPVWHKIIDFYHDYIKSY